MSYSWHVDAIAAAHAAVRDRFDGGGGPGRIRVYDDSAGTPANAAAPAVGVLLGTLLMAAPCGEVDEETGRLAFTTPTRATAGFDGHIGYVRLTDSDDKVYLQLPAAAGVSSVPGYAVFTALDVVAGGYIELGSVTVG